MAGVFDALFAVAPAAPAKPARRYRVRNGICQVCGASGLFIKAGQVLQTAAGKEVPHKCG